MIVKSETDPKEDEGGHKEVCKYFTWFPLVNQTRPRFAVIETRFFADDVLNGLERVLLWSRS